MPTPHRAFALVAHALAGTDPDDREAVGTFYEREFMSYALPARAVIADFLIGSTDIPSEEDLAVLKQVVTGPIEDIPEIEAPVWGGH